METFVDILSAFGGNRQAGEAIGVSEGRIANWKHRGSIPSDYWVDVADAARRLGLIGITVELMARIAQRRRNSGDEAA